MSRLSTESVEKSVDAVQAMDRAQKERLADEIFRMQPNMLGSILVLPRLGVPMEKVEFAVGVLLVCFQAMKESGLAWPVITEDEQSASSRVSWRRRALGEDIAPSLRSRALRRYIAAHPKSLAAYVASDTSKWLGEVAADESDKYAMLAVWNLVELHRLRRAAAVEAHEAHVGVLGAAAFATLRDRPTENRPPRTGERFARAKPGATWIARERQTRPFRALQAFGVPSVAQGEIVARQGGSSDKAGAGSKRRRFDDFTVKRRPADPLRRKPGDGRR